MTVDRLDDIEKCLRTLHDVFSRHLNRHIEHTNDKLQKLEEQSMCTMPYLLRCPKCNDTFKVFFRED